MGLAEAFVDDIEAQLPPLPTLTPQGAVSESTPPVQSQYPLFYLKTVIMQEGGPSLRVPGREAICPMCLSRLVLGEPTTGAAFILDLGGSLSADCCQEPDEGAV